MRIENPILRGFYPDPSVCRVGDLYVLANSTFEYLPGIPIHVSHDLEHWELAGHALSAAAGLPFATAPDSGGLYAPTIRFHDGVFYVACTFIGEGRADNFYVTARDLAGPWSAPVILADARGIDPTIFFHEGRVWWAGCREVEGGAYAGETEIWLRELDLERGELVGDEHVIWRAALRGAVWSEGPHLYARDGWIYLLTAEGGTESDHSVMIARSRQVTGPYQGDPRNPVLTHRHLGRPAAVQMVGHADLFDDVDGGWWAVALGTRPILGHHILGRETHLVGVVWEDGWPVFNPGVGRLDLPVPRPSTAGSDFPRISDFIAVRSAPGEFATDGERGVILRSTGRGPGSPDVVARLLLRLSSTDCIVSFALRDLESDARVGLVIRQSEAFSLRLELTLTTASAVLRLIERRVSDTVLSEVEVPADRLDRIRFDVELTGTSARWSASMPGRNQVPVGSSPLDALSTEVAGGFVGATVGVYLAGPEGATAVLESWSQNDRS